MKKLKVYGGPTMRDGKQVRVVVASTSWAKAAEATGEKLHYIREYWSVTGNDAEITAAMEAPGTPVFLRSNY